MTEAPENPGRSRPSGSASAPRNWRASPWLHGAGLGAIALAVVLRYGLHEYPLQGDRAYFAYLGQAMLRGDPIYPPFNYQPLATLAAAASMRIGGWFDVPTYLAPRYLGVLVMALSASTLYGVVRRATSSFWPGILAGLVLIGFSPLAAASISGVEPKGLVVLFTLATCAALQRRRWCAAGVATALAATCFLPALLTVLASMTVIWSAGWPAGRLAALRYGVGLLLGALPAAIYLTSADAWGEFWRLAVADMAASRGATAGSQPLRWLEVAARHSRNELVFFAAGALGVLWNGTCALRRGPGRMIRSWTQPCLGGVPALTLLWIGFSIVDFNGAPDLLPLLPLVAFWAAWATQRLVALAVSQGRRTGDAELPAILVSILLACTAAYGFADALLYRPAMRLPQQEALVRAIVEPAGPSGTVVAFNASEVYALSERPSPVHPRAVYDVARRDCPGLIQDSIAPGPEVVVMLQGRSRRVFHPCLRRIQFLLLQSGYGLREIEIPWRDHASFVPAEGDVWTTTWLVYERR